VLVGVGGGCLGGVWGVLLLVGCVFFATLPVIHTAQHIIPEALFSFIQSTIEKELVGELNFLQNYDVTKTAIQKIVDMPDQRIDLFIRFCLQNNGVLSRSKRKSHFSELTEEEVQKMQAAIQKAYH
jgi:hypothetical protein